MTGLFIRSLMLALALAGVSCSSTRSVARVVGGTGELPLLEVSIRTLPGSPVRAPKHFQVLERMNPSGFVDIQIPVYNPSSSSRKFRYSWQWMGPDGMGAIDPAQLTWRTGFLEGKDSAYLSSTSTLSQPTAVILRLSPSP